MPRSGPSGCTRRPVACRQPGRRSARSRLWGRAAGTSGGRRPPADRSGAARPGAGRGSQCGGPRPDRAGGRTRREITQTYRRAPMSIHVDTLTDGGQTSLDIARKIATFVGGARETLELALYDIRLDDETGDIVRAALVGAHERGVHVRLVYNVDEVDERPPVPPPPKTEPDLVESLPFETAAVPGWPELMHHKYVVRDRDAVWSGSMNWTDDSWTREENVIVIVESTGIAIRFQEDFAQLWKKRTVAASGRVATEPNS